MNKFNYALALLMLGLSFSTKLSAIEEPIYQVSGVDSAAKTLKKLGAPKAAKLPVTFKKSGTTIEVESLEEKYLSIDFTPAQPFTVSDADVFEKIATSSPRDVVDGKLLVADPSTGRIFHLNHELKVIKLDVIKPWPSKANLQSLKAILEDMMSPSKIEKKK